jgi:hypothetical protein
VISRLHLLLRRKLRHDYFLLKLIHHISIIILRWLRFNLLLQHTYSLFKPLDFKLQVIILFAYSFITRLYKHLLNIGMLALSTKSININIVISFTFIASGGFDSFGCARRFCSVFPKNIKLHFKILRLLLHDIIRVLKSTT